MKVIKMKKRFKVYASSNTSIAASNSDQRITSSTFNLLLSKLKSAGIDTTKYKYEMRAQRYMRYEEGAYYTIKFTCPGDYLAYIAMHVHESLTKAKIVDFFDDYYGIDSENIDDLFDEAPQTLEEMDDYANGYWWGDGDDFIIYLKNLTTNTYLCGPNEEEEDLEDYDEDWD